jgi:hydroxymethylpyrimidine/phosphomethylpyrimidine kinase
MHPAPPVALTIAGSDCSAGAGIQADLKTFEHFHVHGLTAVTCVVSETAEVVRAVFPVPVEIVADQISLLFESFPVAAVKTGMLFSAAHVEAVAEILRRHPGPPLVVDPVMAASSGAPLLEPEAVATCVGHLLPLARLITPNLPEMEILAGRKIANAEELESAALELSARFRTAVLAKGGHLDGADCLDLLAEDGVVTRYSATRIDTRASHGTGCTLSAAIAARLALGDALTSAVASAKIHLGETLLGSYTFPGRGGPDIHALNQGTTL